MNVLQRFIINNTDWKEKLSSFPYCLKIQTKDNLALFMYRTTESDFNEDIVKLSRGCIIDINTGVYICRPYDKFFNIGESRADTIDFKTAVYEEKLDGSIIKLYFNPYIKQWCFATNSMIDANDAKIQGNENFSFLDIIKNTEEYANIKYNQLNKSFTYIFELCSRYNRVVIDYEIPKLVLTGIRNNNNGEYVNIHDINHRTVFKERFGINNIVQAYKISDLKQIPSNIEGCVIKDKIFNMVKVKNKWYIEMHNKINNHSISFKEMFLSGEADEIISYFKEYEEEYRKAEKEYNYIIDEYFDASNDVKTFIGNKDITIKDVRKQVALYINENYKKYMGVLFIDIKNNFNTPYKELAEFLLKAH